MWRKLSVGFLWTMILAIPSTALAVLLAGIITLNLTSIALVLLRWATATTTIGRVWILEFAERWPEAAGMVAGMFVILATLWVTREERARANNEQRNR